MCLHKILCIQLRCVFFRIRISPFAANTTTTTIAPEAQSSLYLSLYCSFIILYLTEMYSPSSGYYWSKIQQGSKRTEAKCKATANTICTFVIALRAAKIRHQFILLHLTVAEIRQLLTICKPPRYIDFRSNETVTETSYMNPEMGSWKHVRFMCHTPRWPSWPRPRCTSPLPATEAWPALCPKKSRLLMSICLQPRPLKKGRTALTYWTCRKRQFRLQLLVHVPLYKMELWWV